MAAVNLDNFGYNEALTKTADYTVTAANSGVVLDVQASSTITLPAIAEAMDGVVAIVRVGKPGITVNVSPNSADKIVGNGFTAAVNKDAIGANLPAGSFIELVASFVSVTTVDTTVNTTQWTVRRILGGWTRET